MERREPTFNAGGDTSNQSLNSEASRRQAPMGDRQKRPQVQVQSTSKVGGFALFIGLIAAAGVGFLFWQFMLAQQALQASNDRIAALEQQLNVSAEGTNQSVATLGARLSKLAESLSKQAEQIETQRKSLAATTDKITSHTKDLVAVKVIANEAKTTLNTLKQDVAANKSLVDASLAKLEPLVMQSEQKMESMNEDINKLELDMGDIDTIERRLKSTEEAIKAIDDFRRTTNREILQLKQQTGLAPAAK